MENSFQPSSKWKKYLKRPDDPVNRLKLELEKSGEKILDLRYGDPALFGFVNTDLSKALIEAAKANWDMYLQNTEWINQLKSAITEFEIRERKVDCSAEEMIIAPGVAGMFRELSFSLLEKGDEVVAFNPSHFLTGPISYWSYLGVKCVPSPTVGERLEPNLEELPRRISKKTKAIVVNSPNNPTGMIYSEKLLKKIVDIAGAYKIPLISDEIYGMITYDKIEATSVASIAEDVPVFVLSGMSKIFMATGWRIGYLYVHDPLGRVKGITKLLKKVAGAYGHGTRSLATPLVVAATCVYERFKRVHFERTLKELEKRRDFAYKRLNKIDGISCVKPQGAFYAFPKIEDVGNRWKTDWEFVYEFLKEEGITFVAGSKYGDRGFGHFRTIFLPSLEIQEQIYQRLEEFMKKHV